MNQKGYKQDANIKWLHNENCRKQANRTTTEVFVGLLCCNQDVRSWLENLKIFLKTF